MCLSLRGEGVNEDNINFRVTLANGYASWIVHSSGISKVNNTALFQMYFIQDSVPFFVLSRWRYPVRLPKNLQTRGVLLF